MRCLAENSLSGVPALHGTRPDLIVLTGSDALAGAALTCVAPEYAVAPTRTNQK